MGKGDERRPSSIPRASFYRNWARIFQREIHDEIARCVNFLRQRGHGSENWWGDDEEEILGFPVRSDPDMPEDEVRLRGANGSFVRITGLETEKAPPAEAEGAESE